MGIPPRRCRSSIRYPAPRRFPLSSALDWLEEAWGGSDGTQGQVLPMDVRETESGYVVEAGLPGIKPDDVEVTLDGRLLTIRGRSSDKRDQDEGRFLLRERRTTSFSRSVTLPAEVDADGVMTTFEDGELCVTLPISKRAGSRRIPIGSGASGARPVGGGSPEAGRTGNGPANGSGEAKGAGQQAGRDKTDNGYARTSAQPEQDAQPVAPGAARQAAGRDHRPMDDVFDIAAIVIVGGLLFLGVYAGRGSDDG